MECRIARARRSSFSAPTFGRPEIVLNTTNRNAEGSDSLEAVIQTSNTLESLPVVTLANVERILRDREYAGKVPDRLLDYLFDIESFRGVGRVFVP